MAKAPNGYLLYRGPSKIDGEPIIVIATGFANASRNAKTGNEIQLWIIREDIAPTTAVKTGADISVCGDCKHRGRSCYVTIFQAPLNIWKTYHRGRYPQMPLGQYQALFAGRMVRFGAYGDPTAAPIGLFSIISTCAAGWTGYTHQWRKADSAWSRYVMASVDTGAEYDQAKALGWRTFRVITSTAPREYFNREIACPASVEAGHKTHCAACKACGGNGAKARADIAIVVHGAASKVNAFNRTIAAL